MIPKKSEYQLNVWPPLELKASINSPKKKAIMQAYPLFSQAQSNIPGGDAKPKNGAGSNCIKVQIINANFNIDKVEAIV